MQPNKPKKTRSEKNAKWIERYCRVPSGPRKGSAVKLDLDQRQLLAAIYDADPLRPISVIGEMGAYLALLHTCGREAPQGNEAADVIPEIAVDPFTLWSATTPHLQEFIERDGAGAVICPGLGTRFPRHRAA